MTISIEPTDFGEDIMASISPLLGAFGLLDANGSVDINNWTLEKALGVFGTYERTEFILNLLSGYISTPRMVYREISSGLIVKKGDLPPSQVQEDEWFSISGGNGWRVSLVVNHQRAGALPNGEHAHHIDLGLGVEVDDLPFTLNSGTLLLNGHLHVPLLRIKNKETSSGTYVVTNDLPEIETERLIWDPTGAYLSRIALSANLSPETGRFGTQAPSAEAIALNCAFGQPHAQDSTSIVAKIALLDFIAQQNGIPSTLEIDIVDAVNGGMAGVLENLVPAMMEMLPDDAQSFAENLLPMLGLLDSDWSTGGVPTVSWPRINIIDLIDELQNDSGQAWNRVRAWLLELTHPEVATQWLTHLYALIFPTAPPPGLVGGSCTQADPAFVKFLDLPGMSGELLIALWEDVAGDKMLDVGLKFNADKSLGNAIDVNGGLTAWIATVPITGGGSIDFFTEFIGDFLLEGIGGTDLMDETVGGGETGSPLDNLHVRLGQARLGVAIQRNGDVEPLIEMLDVDIGSSPVNHYPVIDLTSGSSVMDAIGGVLDTLLDTISDALAENDVLQWLGSLIGLVAPRDGNFRTDWEGAGSAGDLRIDILRMIQNPKDEITDYYARLLETDIDPYGQGSMKAWVYVQEALVLLINTALSGPMKMDKPVMPTGQPAVLGDGTATSPWRLMIGQEGDIPGINFFTYVEPTDVTGVNRLTFGLGCLLSLLQIRPNLHLQLDLDAHLLSLSLADVATDDVPADMKLLTQVACMIKLHDAIGNPGKQMVVVPGGRGFSVTIDAVSLGVRWIREVGFSVRASIHAPRIGSIAPDFPAMMNQLTDPTRIGELMWDGSRLYGGQSVIVPVLDDFLGASDNPPSETVLLSPLDENDTGLPITVSWDYFGLACPEIGFDTKEGLFGLFSRDANTNALIDLGPDEEVYENEGIRMLLGQVLANKGGQWGFFLSTFLRIHPHLLHLDIVKLIMQDGGKLTIPDETPYSWPLSWISHHPKGLGYLGLGPFSLPYDWPEINWAELVNNPYLTLKSFILNILSGVSQSGEPFAFSAFRWFSGLIHGKIPDLTQPCLGWAMEAAKTDESIIQVKIPEIPLLVEGRGTFHNPWKVQLSIEGKKDISLLFWLGPDGPNYVSQLDSIMTAKNLRTFDALQSEVIDVLETSHLGSLNWEYTAAKILLRLANFSPRVKLALGDTSVGRIAEDLKTMDSFLHEGDGLSTLESQLAVFNPNIVSPQTESRLSSVADSLTSAEMANDILMQISKSVPANWSPDDGTSDNGDHVVLLISNRQKPDDWQFLMTKLNEKYNSVCTADILTSDEDLTNYNPQSGVIFFSSLAQDMIGHDSEIRSCIDFLIDKFYTLTIVSHGLTGLSSTSVIEGGGALLAEYIGIATTYQSNHIHPEIDDSGTILIHQGSDGISRAYRQIYPIITPNGPGPEFELMDENNATMAFGPDGLHLDFQGRCLGQYNGYQSYNVGQVFTYVDSDGVERVFRVSKAGVGLTNPDLSGVDYAVWFDFNFGREYDETQIFNLITINTPHHGVGDPRYTDLHNPIRVEMEFVEKFDDYPNNLACQVGELIKHTDDYGTCRYYVVEVAGNAGAPPTHEEGTIQLDADPNSPHLRYLYTEDEFLPIQQKRIRRALHLLNSLGLSNHQNPLTEPIDFAFDVQFNKGEVIRYTDGNDNRNLYYIVNPGSVSAGNGEIPQALHTTQIIGQSGLELKFLFEEQGTSKTLTLNRLSKIIQHVSIDYSSLLNGGEV
jgi:hypothetical protein